MYAMVCRRPNIAHAIGVVSGSLQNPGKQHWEESCLRGTSKVCLREDIAYAKRFTDADMSGDHIVHIN